jgi:hypothetical protein
MLLGCQKYFSLNCLWPVGRVPATLRTGYWILLPDVTARPAAELWSWHRAPGIVTRLRAADRGRNRGSI